MICKLTTDIYRLQIPFSNIYTSIFLIRTPEGTVVYDTGTYASDISKYLTPALQELGLDRPCAVVVSHNHGDHAGGLSAFHEHFPDTPIYAGSEACAERVDAQVNVLRDDEALCGVLKAIHIPGHTADAVGLYDNRTKTLISGDCLQVYGIYGKGKWGTSIPFAEAHFEAINRLKAMDIERLYAAHHYEPYGNEAVGGETVKKYLCKCQQALTELKAYASAHPGRTPEELAEGYAKETDLPVPPAKTFAAFNQ